jgi:hypothetical protein
VAAVHSLAAFAAEPLTIPICPPSISETEHITGPVPAGWTVLTIALPQKLDNVGFATGDLIEAGVLIGPSARLATNIEATYWDLSGDPDEWIYCSYMNAATTIYAKLPPSTVACEMISSVPGYVLKNISCTPAP